MSDENFSFGENQNPYQAPAAYLAEPTPETMEFADRGTRLGAHILDWLVFLPLGGIIGLLFFWLMMAHGTGMSWGEAWGAALNFSRGMTRDVRLLLGVALGIAVLFLGLVGLNLYWLHRHGQTIGKRICKIKVVRTDGSRVSLGRIIGLRWLPVAAMQMIPLVGFLVKFIDPLMIFRESYQCLHDQIADTIVVKVGRN